MCLNFYNARGNLSGHNLTPLKKGMPTTELVWFTSPRDINLMEPSPVADKYILWYSVSVVYSQHDRGLTHQLLNYYATCCCSLVFEYFRIKKNLQKDVTVKICRSTMNF